MREITKGCLTTTCGLMSITCLGAGWACQIVGRDSIALTLVGRNLSWLGYGLAGATFAYTGVEFMYFWNERCASQVDEEQPLNINYRGCEI